MNKKFGFVEEERYILVKGSKAKPIRFKTKSSILKFKELHKLEDWKIEKIKTMVMKKRK